MSRIEVERVSDDRLSRQVWAFFADTTWHRGKSIVGLRPNWYAVQTRETTRHKWRTVKQWDRMDERSYHSSIKRDDVPLPVDVCKEAISAVTVEILDIGS